MKDVPKEFRVDMRLRNNRLLEAREELGLSGRVAASKIGINLQMLYLYEGMKCGPWNEPKKEWKSSATAIIFFYDKPYEYFWPDAVLAVEKTHGALKIGAEDLGLLLGGSPKTPEDRLMEVEKMEPVWDVMDRLSEKERLVVVGHTYGDCTLAEMGKELAPHVLKPCEWARQLEAQALRKIRKFLGEKGMEKVLHGLHPAYRRQPEEDARLLQALSGHPL